MRTLGNLLAFAPELWLLGGALVIFILGRLLGQRTAAEGTVIGLAALAGAVIALITQFRSTLNILDGAFLVDGHSQFFGVLLLGAAALTLLLGLAYSRRLEGVAGDFAGFVLLATGGAMLTASAGEMISLFASLELLGVNLYVMAALLRREGDATQVALRYMVIGLAGSAALAYGMAILYGLTGETSLKAVGTVLANQDGISPALVLALGLVLGGFTVKLGAAPLQWWVPDVFEAVPLPVVGFIASSGLAATFAVFLRFMEWSFAPSKVAVPAVLALVAAVSMTFGNLAALFEDRLRRLLAYSTAAQAGYALAGLAAFKQEGGISAVLIFILALALANLAALTAVVGYQRAMESDRLADLAGMSRHAPGLALVLGLAVASLIGAPPLAGFFGKLLVTQSVIQAGFTWLAILVLVNSLVAAIYYLRVLKAVFIDPAGFELDPVHYGGSLRTAMTVSAAGLMASTVFLGPLYTAAGHAARALLH